MVAIGTNLIAAPARRRWLVEGRVQGVGFRPFIWRLAREHNLAGFVRNEGCGVTIEAQGDETELHAFDADLARCAPTGAIIRKIRAESIGLLRAAHNFEILPSTFTAAESTTADSSASELTPDLAACDDCVDEALAPRDRRHHHGLISCTHCGPRFSIIQSTPYDRHRTTMAAFELCGRCEREYSDPEDRRFHAQPICCPDCGPQVRLSDATGRALAGDPYVAAAALLAAGGIIAIKGIGGYHLAARADDPAAIRRLRDLKHRDRKPFAIMAADLPAAQRLAHFSAAALLELASPARPIILAIKSNVAASKLSPDIAPGTHRLGIMLPYTPIQHLLYAALRDCGFAIDALVMTSANPCDEPLITEDVDAFARLGRMCDAILWHDRPIQRGIDDSVLIDAESSRRDCPEHCAQSSTQPAPTSPAIKSLPSLIPIRRARGYVPAAIPLPLPHALPGLCVGGELKNAFAIVKNREAILSPHLGDLSHPKSLANFRRAIDDLLKLLAVDPRFIACDAHPMYLSSAFAKEFAARLKVPLVRVQHHHAHAASLMAEHHLTGPILAVVCDGVGYALDGATWGGELLQADFHGFTRLASLSPLNLPGGDAAARQTARCGLALMHQALGADFLDHPAARRMVPDDSRRAMLGRMIRDNISCTATSAAGRYFDAVAAILGLCDENTFEAQSGLALEAAANQANPSTPGPDLFRLLEANPLIRCNPLAEAGPMRIDLSPLTRALLNGMETAAPIPDLARLFHEQLAAAWEAAIARAVAQSGITTIGLTGGVFCNVLLTQSLSRRLEKRGLAVLRHRLVPPNDGGIALGQAAIACAQLAQPVTTQGGV